MGYQYVGFNALGFELHGYHETKHGEEHRDSHMWIKVLHTLIASNLNWRLEF